VCFRVNFNGADLRHGFERFLQVSGIRGSTEFGDFESGGFHATDLSVQAVNLPWGGFGVYLPARTRCRRGRANLARPLAAETHISGGLVGAYSSTVRAGDS
jgi:hypothetical protein